MESIKRKSDWKDNKLTNKKYSISISSFLANTFVI